VIPSLLPQIPAMVSNVTGLVLAVVLLRRWPAVMGLAIAGFAGRIGVAIGWTVVSAAASFGLSQDPAYIAVRVGISALGAVASLLLVAAAVVGRHR
jgi:hypothetical protein